MASPTLAEPGSVFLVGFMGAGKSTVGGALARAIGLGFADTDEIVERALGRSIARVLTESGEAFFRDAERRAIDALDVGRPLVVACGGGAFSDPATRRRLARNGHTVWLDVPLDVVRARLAQDGAVRPLWNADDPVGQRILFERRRAVYALARIRIDGAAGPPEVVARRIRERLREVPC
jgi:shikimate kinase